MSNKVAIRREKLLNYLAEREEASTDDILKYLNTKKETLSGDIKALNGQGFNITQPRRKWWRLGDEVTQIEESARADGPAKGPGPQKARAEKGNSQSATGSTGASKNGTTKKQKIEPYGKLKDEDIRMWLLMHLLGQSSKPLPIKKIMEDSEERGWKLDGSTVRIDLERLEKRGLVKSDGKNPTHYSPTSIAPSYVTINEDDMERILLDYFDFGFADILTEGIGEKLESIESLMYGQDESRQVSSSYKSFGKRAIFSKRMVDKLEELLALPFDERLLKIDLRAPDKSGTKKSILFDVGLIFFGADTNQVYLFGDAMKNEKGTFQIIRLEAIDHVEAADEKKTKGYPNQKYKKMFYEMWGVNPGSGEVAEKVLVKFKNLPYVREKVELLQTSRRATARCQLTEDGEYILYSDEIRGTTAFGRLIRRFGRAAEVIEPAGLRKTMIAGTREQVAAYKEVLKNE